MYSHKTVTLTLLNRYTCIHNDIFYKLLFRVGRDLSFFKFNQNLVFSKNLIFLMLVD